MESQLYLNQYSCDEDSIPYFQLKGSKKIRKHKRQRTPQQSFQDFSFVANMQLASSNQEAIIYRMIENRQQSYVKNSVICNWMQNYESNNQKCYQNRIGSIKTESDTQDESWNTKYQHPVFMDVDQFFQQ